MIQKFYLVTIQHNRISQSENRTVPKSFNTLNDAIASFHKQMGTDMTNDTLDWAISMIFDNDGIVYKNETWVRQEEAVETEQ